MQNKIYLAIKNSSYKYAKELKTFYAELHDVDLIKLRNLRFANF